jgi:hypothetical protein
MESFEGDFTVSNTSAYIAAREAMAGFEAADESAPKAFIYTGNFPRSSHRPYGAIYHAGRRKERGKLLGWRSLVNLQGEGLQVSRIFYVSCCLWNCSEPNVEFDRFHFADERTPEGGPITRLEELSRPGAAEFYLELVEGNKDIPWFATFVTGKGFVDFPGTRRL